MTLRIVLRIRAMLRRVTKPVTEAVVGSLAIAILRMTRRFDPDKSADFFASIAKRIGPWLRENKVARDNLIAAFPEKSATEIEIILAEVWDNLGRVAAEFIHIDRIFKIDQTNTMETRIEIPPRTSKLFEELALDGKGALLFSAHLGNWELPALAGPAFDVPFAILFRRPNIGAVDRAIQEIRNVNMGTMVATTPDAPLRLAQMLQDGVHVGMLVDQFYDRGARLNFFGRTARTNMTLARISRHVDCPIHGVRVVRLPNRRFRIEMTEAIDPARHGSGQIDAEGTMQKINNVIEGWVREYPGQWLWLHRRWRNY